MIFLAYQLPRPLGFPAISLVTVPVHLCVTPALVSKCLNAPRAHYSLPVPHSPQLTPSGPRVLCTPARLFLGLPNSHSQLPSPYGLMDT